MKPEHKEYILNNAEKKKPVLLSVILIIALGFAVYANSLNNEFFWDDEALVTGNKYIKSWSYLPQIFTNTLGAGTDEGWNSYRPLQSLTYMIDYSLWKLDPRGYHITNIFLHISAALGIYWLINIIFGKNLLALLTGIFFVIHPVHIEAVTYISGRSDSLALLFTLLSFILYLKSPPSKRVGSKYALLLLSYSLALLSRESSLILPVLILVYHYSFKTQLKGKEFFSVVSIASIYILIRLTVLKVLLATAPSAFPTTLLQRLPSFFASVASYIRLLFFPFDLHMEYGMVLFSWNDPKTITGIALFFILLICAFKKRERSPLISFSILWFFVSLLPVSNLFPINAYMAEHWLYLPSIGFFLIAAEIVHSLYTAKNLKIPAIIIIASLSGFYSFLTVRQNAYWSDPISFYERTLKFAPYSSRVHSNLGNEFNSVGQREKAIAAYKKAIEINPRYAKAHFNLGNVYINMGKRAEAIASYQRAVEIKSDYPTALYNLGNAYKAMNKNKGAIAAYRKVVEINPDHANAHNNLGTVYAASNRYREAIASYKNAIRVKPDYPEAYNNLGAVYAAMNKNKEAIASYKKAIEIDAGFENAYINLGVIHKSMKNYDEAITSYRKAIEINDDHAGAYFNLGNIYANLKRTVEAVDSYKKAIERKTNFAKAYLNLGNIYKASGNIDGALSSYKKAINIDPNYALAHNHLAAIYFQEKNYPLAITHYDKAKELGSKNAALLEALKPYR